MINNPKNKIGFMQGRLSPIVNNRIQAFPLSNWENELTIASLNGFEIIEWTIDYWKYSSNPILAQDAELLYNKLENHGIKISGVTCDHLMHFPFWRGDGAIVDAIIEEFVNLLKKLICLNVGYVVIPLVDNGTVEDAAQEDFLVQKIQSIIESNDLENINILFETDKGPRDVMKFIKKFEGYNQIGINYDVGNSAALGYDMESEFQCYGNYIKNIHLKDRKLGGSSVRLGHGNTDFSKFKKLIEFIEYEGYFIFQTARSSNGRHLEELNINKDFFLELMV